MFVIRFVIRFYQNLSDERKAIKIPKNLNTNFGIPLSIQFVGYTRFYDRLGAVYIVHYSRGYSKKLILLDNGIVYQHDYSSYPDDMESSLTPYQSSGAKDSVPYKLVF